MSNDVLGVRRPERDMLRGFLDWYRAVVTNKLVGLSLEQASQVMTPTGLSPLGILKHLASSEAGWLRGCFAGQPVPAEVAGPQSFRVAPHDTIDSVVAVSGTSARTHVRSPTPRPPSTSSPHAPLTLTAM